MACIGCELLPELPMAAGQLLLAPPLEHTQVKLRERLRAVDLHYTAQENGPLAVAVGAGELEAVLLQLGEALSAPELEHTNSAFVVEGTPADLRLLGAIVPLARLVARVRGRWLVETIREGRLTSYFQPIVYAGEPTRVYAHECLLRGRAADGELIAPGVLFDAAQASGMLFHLDRAARLTAIGEATRLRLTTPLFINFIPTAIYDPAFCLRATIDAFNRRARKAAVDPFGRARLRPLADSRDRDDRATCRLSRATQRTRQNHVGKEEMVDDVPNAIFQSCQSDIPFL